MFKHPHTRSPPRGATIRDTFSMVDDAELLEKRESYSLRPTCKSNRDHAETKFAWLTVQKVFPRQKHKMASAPEKKDFVPEHKDCLHAGYGHALLKQWQAEATLQKLNILYPIFVTSEFSTRLSVQLALLITSLAPDFSE